MLSTTTTLANIKGLPPRFLVKLQKLDIMTVRDLLWHFPTRYEDFSSVVKIADLETNQSATVQGFIRKVAVRRTYRKHMAVVEATIADETGAISAIWFNQPFIAKNLRIGHLANFAGKVSVADDGMFLSNPSYELVSGIASETRHTAGLIPIYPETKGLTSKGIRYLVKVILANIAPLEDFIPPEVLQKNRLPELNTALRALHFPKNLDDAAAAKRRFAFEDLFLLQINNIKARLQLAKEKAPPLPATEEELHAIMAKLPFELTPSQKQSLHEIVSDIALGRPMNRLLQGDVGSGKTVIAAIAAVIAAKNGQQTAFMAPTEVLARQHYKTLTDIFGHLNIPIALLTSSESKMFFESGLEAPSKKADVQKKVREGEINIVIGTHAIISPYGRSPEGRQKGIQFKNLALAIVDEQHRFGVGQRAALVAEKDASIPHFLSMSATPIPRTLTLTIFGDLDLSLITELPVGRKPIITKVVAPENRPKAYAFIRGEIQKGRQAFVICPRIEKAEHAEESETGRRLAEAGSGHAEAGKQAKAWSEVKAVKDEYEKLTAKIFPDLRVGMLHGKLKPT
ncbi:MAG: DEAD/DEAH box helicase, partial [Candidatus Harrisonbacteria bacterium]|nr:DEAD/DEAH box helicase [Candidatus Harrisonbacteria bacterium]